VSRRIFGEDRIGRTATGKGKLANMRWIVGTERKQKWWSVPNKSQGSPALDTTHQPITTGHYFSPKLVTTSLPFKGDLRPGQPYTLLVNPSQFGE
jgi:hypothetical protein